MNQLQLVQDIEQEILTYQTEFLEYFSQLEKEK